MKNIRKLSLILLLIFTLGLVGCEYVPPKEMTGAFVNENGVLMLEYSDGTVLEVGEVKGRDGVDGVDGKDGTDGKDGMDGADGADGKDGIDGLPSSSGAATSLSDAACRGLRSYVNVQSMFRENTVEAKVYYNAGAGVIYQLNKTAGSAFIITNYHVVQDSKSSARDGISEQISVYLYGAEYSDLAIDVTYVGGSAYYDIAVLYAENCDALKGETPMAVKVSNSDRVRPGEPAIAVGNPEGDGTSVTVGAVSVDSEHITLDASLGDMRVMRVDTPINHGNSGGGLYNDRGELIGIVNARLFDSEIDGIAYAIPSNVAVAVAQNIIDNCFGTDNTAVKRPLLGITITTQNSGAVYDAEEYRVYIVEDVVIHEVSATSVLYGKVQVNDRILRISDGTRTLDVTRQFHIIDFLLGSRLNDTVTLTVLRDGQTLSYEVKITEQMIADC